ncbi:MAG: aminopeptidase 1 [Acidobacteria bacterium]|nr:aminopeptidase 1 [Acidobacteriota bacterium]
MRKFLLSIAIVLLGAVVSPAQEAGSESNFQQDAWARIPESDAARVEALAQEYKDFLRRARHELLAVAEAVRLAKAKGFRPLEELERLRAGDRVYVINRDRAMILAVVGSAPLVEGATLSAAHIDSPRIELKANPLYEKEGFALFQTTYHGGIKKYQWASIPLALVGRVSKKDGTSLDIAIGLEGEPYLVIPDLAPHVDRPFRDRKQQEVLKGEELDPIVGTRPDAEGSVMGTVLAVLEKKYGIGREDFISAQLALVPALPPADVGLDASLVGAYGQDDRLCSFISLRALLDVRRPKLTAMVYLAANEEVGSHNVMGAGSSFLADTVLALQEKAGGGEVTFSAHRRAMRSIHAVSADTPTAVHPTFASVQEKTNAARLGGGVVLKRYGRGTDPTSEVLAKVRALLDSNGIPWQTSTYKVDIARGGTLGRFLSDDGMDVVDIGAPLVSMHSTWSLSSKADLWWLYRFFGAFFAME